LLINQQIIKPKASGIFQQWESKGIVWWKNRS